MGWDSARGFGFIRPSDGGKDVFVHVSAFPQGQVPSIGGRIVFSAVDDARGRGQRALKAVINGPGTGAAASPPTSPPRASKTGQRRPPSRPAVAGAHPGARSTAGKGRPRDQALRRLPLSALTLAVAVATLFCLSGALSFLPVSPIPLLAYPIFSLAAVFIYARDKLSALRGQWRVPESSLHLVEAAGGWPGAYIAQQTMRHKTVKQSYQVVYWGIVASHVGFWALWLLSPDLVRPWLPPLAALG